MARDRLRAVQRAGEASGAPPLRDPDACPYFCCRGRTRVLSKRHRADGVVRRRHACTCGRRWTSWQSLLDPRLVPADDVDPALRADARHDAKRYP